MSEFVNKPKFHKNQLVKTIFPKNSRHFSLGKIKTIIECEIYKKIYHHDNITGEVEVEDDFTSIEGYHFIYTLDNGRSFDESLLIPL